MESEVKKMGYTWQEIVSMAQRRIQWRAFIDGSCSQGIDEHKVRYARIVVSNQASNLQWLLSHAYASPHSCLTDCVSRERSKFALMNT